MGALLSQPHSRIAEDYEVKEKQLNVAALTKVLATRVVTLNLLRLWIGFMYYLDDGYLND